MRQLASSRPPSVTFTMAGRSSFTSAWNMPSPDLTLGLKPGSSGALGASRSSWKDSCGASAPVMRSDSVESSGTLISGSFFIRSVIAALVSRKGGLPV